MQNKIAVVSGGAGGIGRAVVLRLSEAGFFPVILDKNQVAGEQLLFSLARRGKKGAFVALDLMVKAEVHNAFAKINTDYGRIDVLVNLAGGTFHKKVIQDLSLAEWRDVINMNLKATFLCCQAVIQTMKRQTKGSIVNTASNFGITGSAERTHYSAAKAALIAFSKSLALGWLLTEYA